MKLKNYKELYKFGVQTLDSHTIPNAHYDARLLLEFICNTNHSDLHLHGDREMTQEEMTKYQEVIEQRANHIPLQYIIGTQEFMGLSFHVSPFVLIPRQDTEILVEAVLKHLHDKMSILDMCTGSGCILISLLRYSNDCEGVGVDISKDALNIAIENGNRHQINAQWLESNLFEKVEGKFDMIVSNPPYIRSDVIPTLMEEVKDYEPMIALEGGDDGLHFYHKIIKEAKHHLNRGGMLFFEIGHDQKKEVMNVMKKEGYTDINALQDYAGNDRVIIGTFLEETHV